jgi:hypothetical protein
VLSYFYFKQLAAKASKAKESAVATVPNSAANGNASASAGGRVRREYVNLGSNVHLSKHSTAKHAIHGVIVQAGEGTGGSTSNVSAADATDKGAAGKEGSVLLQQGIV